MILNNAYMDKTAKKVGGQTNPLIGANYEKNYTNSPAYQFQVNQGNQQLDKQMARLGNLRSGAAIQARQNMMTNIGAQEADKIRQNAQQDASRSADYYTQDANRNAEIKTADANRGADLYKFGVNTNVGMSTDNANRNADLYKFGVGTQVGVSEGNANRNADLYKFGVDKTIGVHESAADRTERYQQNEADRLMRDKEGQTNNLFRMAELGLSQSPLGTAYNAMNQYANYDKNYSDAQNRITQDQYNRVQANMPRGGGGGGMAPTGPDYTNANNTRLGYDAINMIYGQNANNQGNAVRQGVNSGGGTNWGQIGQAGASLINAYNNYGNRNSGGGFGPVSNGDTYGKLLGR